MATQQARFYNDKPTDAAYSLDFEVEIDAVMIKSGSFLWKMFK